MTALETAVPSDCWIPPESVLLGTKPLQTDNFVVNDAQYRITESDGVVWVAFGNLNFCIGTKVETLPTEQVDALICAKWAGEPSKMPEETYWKEDAIQIQVYPDGNWAVEKMM